MSLSKTLSVVSGFFSPLGEHHIKLFQSAAQIAPLVVIINNDEQLKAKTGHVFQPASEREAIIKALGCVSQTFIAADTDHTVCKTLTKVANLFADHQIIFCNGGDRCTVDGPETEICKKLGIIIAIGVGGWEKTGASSTTLGKYRQSIQGVKWFTSERIYNNSFTPVFYNAFSNPPVSGIITKERPNGC